MDFALLLAKGLGAGIGVVLALMVAGVWIWRKKKVGYRMGVGAVGTALGFAAGYLVFWGWPGVWPGEAWQMAFADAVVLGVLVGLSMAGRGVVRGILLVAAVGVTTGLTVRGKLTPLEVFLPGMAGAMGIYLVGLWPTVREGRVWLTGMGVMFVSAFGAAVVVMLNVDQNTGRMLVLICALAGMLVVAGFIRPLRDGARGGVVVLAMMYAGVLGLAAYYNFALPNSVFILLAMGPVGAAAGWVRGLRKRPWVCLIVAILITLAVVVPGVVIAVRSAPAMDG